MFRILCGLVLAFWATAASAGLVIDDTSGGGPDTWYYGVGSDNYPNTSSYANTALRGDVVTIATGGTVTQISFKLAATNAGSTKLGIYWDNAGTWTLHECGTLSNNVAAGWRDYTLLSGLTVTNGQQVLVQLIPSESTGVLRRNLTGGASSTGVYGDACYAIPPAISDGSEPGVRVYVD